MPPGPGCWPTWTATAGPGTSCSSRRPAPAADRSSCRTRPGRAATRTAGGHWASRFRTDEAGNGTWLVADMDGDGALDLVYVKTKNTASGRVEVYYASAADGYQRRTGGYTPFDVADGPNGTWQVVPAGSLTPP